MMSRCVLCGKFEACGNGRGDPRQTLPGELRNKRGMNGLTQDPIQENSMEFESKLIPILREGVDVIKMILFKKLKTHLPNKYPHKDAKYINWLSGAIINELFGAPNPAEPFATFVSENKFFIKLETKDITSSFPEMRIPLTDALRVQFLCDSQEGIDSAHVLAQAKQLGILLTDRDAPLPAQFMGLVRRLGSSFSITTQPAESSNQ